MSKTVMILVYIVKNCIKISQNEKPEQTGSC